MVNDFVTDAMFGGVGSFLVFVLQIMVLTFIIGLLEDSGYLARAALICHKPLSYLVYQVEVSFLTCQDIPALFPRLWLREP
jgi:hypothetical protein